LPLRADDGKQRATGRKHTVVSLGQNVIEFIEPNIPEAAQTSCDDLLGTHQPGLS